MPTQECSSLGGELCFTPTCTSRYTGELMQCQCILVENTTFDNNFVNFSLNVAKFGVLINIYLIDKLRDFGWYGDNFGGIL